MEGKSQGWPTRITDNIYYTKSQSEDLKKISLCWLLISCTYLFSDLTGHLFSKVPVLTDSVEQLATLHHLHNYQEPRSVKRNKVWMVMKSNKNRMDWLKSTLHRKIYTHINTELFTLGWTHVGIGHCWRKPPGSALCLDGWHTSYGDAPTWTRIKHCV